MPVSLCWLKTVSDYLKFSGGEDCYIRLWDIKSGEMLFREKFMNSIPSAVCWPRSSAGRGMIIPSCPLCARSCHTWSSLLLLVRSTNSCIYLFWNEQQTAKITEITGRIIVWVRGLDQTRGSFTWTGCDYGTFSSHMASSMRHQKWCRECCDFEELKVGVDRNIGILH